MKNQFKSKFLFPVVIDLDLTAEYPNIIIVYNINNDTQYGKILFKKGHPDVPEIEVEVPAVEFVDSFITRNYIDMGTRFFNLPKTSELIDMIKENPKKYLNK